MLIQLIMASSVDTESQTLKRKKVGNSSLKSFPYCEPGTKFYYRDQGSRISAPPHPSQESEKIASLWRDRIFQPKIGRPSNYDAAAADWPLDQWAKFSTRKTYLGPELPLSLLGPSLGTRAFWGGFGAVRQTNNVAERPFIEMQCFVL